MSAHALGNLHHQPANEGVRPTVGIRQGAAWHGFRLASLNEAPLAVGGASHRVDAGDAREAAMGIDDDPDGSLAWLGRLACWTSALLTASLIVLAVN